MAFADSAQAQDESAAVFRRAGLIRMPDDARIEQRRSFERIFVKEISPDEAALRLIERRMGRERAFHFRGASFENLEQIPVASFEIIEDVAQLLRRGFRIEAKNPVDDMVRPGLVDRIEVARFSRGFERPNDDSGRIRP